MKLKSKSIFAVVVMITVFFACSKNEPELQKLIGHQITSQPVQDYLNKIGAEPEIAKAKYDDTYYYIFKSKGIDFLFSNSDSLQCIFLFSESADNHRQFQSEIPFGLTFNDTRKVVEEKLGPPDKNGGAGVINFYSAWDRIGISVTYKTIDQEDMMNRIHHISLIGKEN